LRHANRLSHIPPILTEATVPLRAPHWAEKYLPRISEPVPTALIAVGFAVLFYQPFAMLLRDWWELPDAGHGLLLAPIAVWLAWRAGRDPQSAGQAGLGAALLIGAVVIRYASGLAAELFSMRMSMVAALAGLTVYFAGMRQAKRWWLSFALLALSVPLPELVTQALALPLQFKASQMGAAMLEMRNVPVLLSGNVIRLPTQELFVTEACSGLRSLTAIISMAVLVGALFLRTPAARVAVLLLAIPIAIVVNGVRVFLTGFLVYYASPELGRGFMHTTEGWLLFLVSLLGLAGVAALAAIIERRLAPGPLHA
jgi:exosortase